MRVPWVLAAVVLAACGGDDDASRPDCEAVIAHLVVLEKLADEGTSGPMCKYHDSCDGSERRHWIAECPHVLSRRTARCYQRATSITEADLCMSRVELDARIQSGRGDRGGDRYGGGLAWLGGGPPPLSRSARALRELTALRDQACACHDTACSDAITHRLDDLARQYDDLRKDPDVLRDGEKIATELSECLMRATTPPDAGVADAAVIDPNSATGIADCDTYLQMLDRYASCPQVGQAARDSLRDSSRQMRDSWRSIATQPDAARQAGDACRQAADAIKQAMASMGC